VQFFFFLFFVQILLAHVGVLMLAVKFEAPQPQACLAEHRRPRSRMLSPAKDEPKQEPGK